MCTPARHRRQHGWTCPQLQRWCPQIFGNGGRREGLEVGLSREWVRSFLVSIDLSHKAAAQRRGPSTPVPRPNRCCKRSSATFLQPCDVGLMRPFKVDAMVMMSAPSYLAVISTVSGWELRNTGKLDSGETLWTRRHFKLTGNTLCRLCLSQSRLRLALTTVIQLRIVFPQLHW